MWKWIATGFFLCWMQGALAEDLTAADIIRKAMDHYRGQTSYSEMTMVIHRPDWQREMTMRAWTEGDKQTLVRVMQPAKDAGNGTLNVANGGVVSNSNTDGYIGYDPNSTGVATVTDPNSRWNNGIELYLVITPEFSKQLIGFKERMQAVSGINVPVFDYRNNKSILIEEYYNDSLHLNNLGAKELSKSIALDLIRAHSFLYHN